MLVVKFGSIYDKNGIMIDNMAVIFNKDFGLYKYGELRDIEKYYNDLSVKFKNNGLEDLMQDYSLINFDRYNSELCVNEVCVIVNFMLNTTNAESVLSLLELTIQEIKQEVLKLTKMGY